jgi:hypothetical protein
LRVRPGHDSAGIVENPRWFAAAVVGFLAVGTYHDRSVLHDMREKG